MEDLRFYLLSQETNATSWNYVISDVSYREEVIRWCHDHLGERRNGNWNLVCDIFSLHTPENAMAFKLRWC